MHPNIPTGVDWNNTRGIRQVSKILKGAYDIRGDAHNLFVTLPTVGELALLKAGFPELKWPQPITKCFKQRYQNNLIWINK